MTYVDVILPLPLEGVFTYSIPTRFEHRIRPGMRVHVPIGKSKTYIAIAYRVHGNKPGFDTRPVMDVPDEDPILLPEQLRLWDWIADYYLSTLGDIYRAALPAGLKDKEGYRPKTEPCLTLAPALRNERTLHTALDMLRRADKQLRVMADFLALSHWDGIEGDNVPADVMPVTKDELMNVSHCTAAVIKALVDRKFLVSFNREVPRLNLGKQLAASPVNRLSEAQQKAYDELLLQMEKKRVVLLHGVTSSGKTEVFIHLIRKAMDEGRQVLYLLPEIALTVQMMERLQRVFGDRLGIYHSKYSDAERVEIWKRQLSDHPYDVVLGARSAVFLPFRRLGLVIVDEEHETSFKQQDPAPRYHARSAAIVLAGYCQANVVLGTATPSMESYFNAVQGKYGLVELKTRYQGIALPEVRIVDTKDLRRRKIMKGIFSPQLLQAVREALQTGKQAILFQNRRGFAPMIECKVCGWVPKCDHCDVSLTLHKNLNQLSCHYCGYTYSVPDVCPCCGSKELRGRGLGTEKVEDTVREVFPEARISRMDLDTTRTRQAYERLIGDFSSGRTNLLIGTQMVSKGLDFGNVSVVGIIDADNMFNYPDFRAYEHAFSMLSQVSGRAGRKGGQGQVMLQTRNPELPVIGQVVRHDFGGFFRHMLEERRQFHYPPYYRLIYIYLKHSRENIVDTASMELASRLRQALSTRVLGPDQPAVARVKTLYIRKIVLKLEAGIDLSRVRMCLRQTEKALRSDKRYAVLQVYYDVDPL
ncbi:MAG: primosomal protein N' [Prevotella sp.]